MRHDYALTIEEVSRRLNKSIRTIHRYKTQGRLSCIMGSSQGSPLFFSRTEVEEFAKQLDPREKNADPLFWERLDRLEKLLNLAEQNPLLDRILSNPALDPKVRGAFREVLQALEAAESSNDGFDSHAFGLKLIGLGKSLLNPS